MHFTAFDHPAAGLVRRAPILYGGKRPVHFCSRGAPRRARLERPFTIDGEFFHRRQGRAGGAEEEVRYVKLARVSPRPQLRDRRDELAAPVDLAVAAVPRRARRARRGVSAVLFYGAACRDGYRDGAGRPLPAGDAYAGNGPCAQNRWCCPTSTTPSRARAMVRAKSQLVSLDQFERRMRTRNSFWALRAADGLVWARDGAARGVPRRSPPPNGRPWTRRARLG